MDQSNERSDDQAIGHLEVPLSGLAPGLYLVKVNVGKEFISRKFIIR